MIPDFRCFVNPDAASGKSVGNRKDYPKPLAICARLWYDVIGISQKELLFDV